MLEKVRELFIKDGWSLYKIAKDADLGYSLFQDIYNWKTKKTIRLDTAIKLADAIKVDINEFLEH